MKQWRHAALMLADLEVSLGHLSAAPPDEAPECRARRQLMLLRARARYVGFLEVMESLCAAARRALPAPAAPQEVPDDEPAGHLSRSIHG